YRVHRYLHSFPTRRSSDLYFTDVLGGRLRFAVEGMGARVAAIELAPPPPLLLLADHVKGSTPILVYRVASLTRALAKLTKHGWRSEEHTSELQSLAYLVCR